MLSLVGHSSLAALLADLVANQSVAPTVLEADEEGTNVAQTVWVPLSQVRAAGSVVGEALSSGQLRHAPDYGMERVPRPIRYPCGYQGQGTSVSGIPLDYRP